MSTALCFNDITLSPVTHQNSLWIQARNLANALGYKDERSVHKIYERNKEEFSSMMSTVVNLTTGIAEVPTRIFSLRGCHLIAMFARTPVAKAFRRWVLDVIEQYGDKVPVPEGAELPISQRTYTLPAAPYDTATKDQRRPIDQALKAWVAATHANGRLVLHAEAWKILRVHFGNISRIDQIPAVWVDDAAQFCREMMQKELQAAPEQKALPQAQASLPVSQPRRESLLSDAEKDRLEAAGQRVIALSVYIRREVHELYMEILRAVDPRRVPVSVWDAMNSHIYYSLLGAVSLPPESLTHDTLFDKENRNPAYWTMEMLKDMPALR